VTEIQKPDAKKRLSLGGAMSKAGSAYNIYCNRLGQIVLDPVMAVPAYEAWLFGNKKALASVKRGLATRPPAGRSLSVHSPRTRKTEMHGNCVSRRKLRRSSRRWRPTQQRRPAQTSAEDAGLLEINPRHPGLHTHEFSSLAGPDGERIWEAYAQNNTPGAYRVFFHYGPDEGSGKNGCPC